MGVPARSGVRSANGLLPHYKLRDGTPLLLWGGVVVFPGTNFLALTFGDKNSGSTSFAVRPQRTGGQNDPARIRPDRALSLTVSGKGRRG